MAVALDVVDDRAVQVEAVPRPARIRRPRVVVTVALLVVLVVLVFIFGNERQATTQFEQSHDALVQTNARNAAAEIQLAAVRRDLEFLEDADQLLRDRPLFGLGDVAKCANRSGAGPGGCLGQVRLYREPQGVSGWRTASTECPLGGRREPCGLRVERCLPRLPECHDLWWVSEDAPNGCAFLSCW